VLLLGGAAFGITQLTGSGGSDESNTSAAGAAPSLSLVRNSTGADYSGRDDLVAAVPRLLAGSASQELAAPAPQAAGGAAAGTAQSDSSKVSGGTTTQLPAAPMRVAAADALAPLRADAGLAECLAALLPADDPSVQPLALDYGTFKGQPAMVVVLPSASPKTLDVFVVGPGCSRANDSVLFYASVPAS
jgi:hypothetical protein